MIPLQLFLGFCPDHAFQGHQKKANPHLVSLLKSGGDYLQELSHNGQTFLGKKVLSPLSFEDLKLLEANVVSLLKKIAPEYPYSPNSLVLLTFIDN